MGDVALPGGFLMGPYIRSIRLKADPQRDLERFPFTIPAVRGLGELDLDVPVTVLVGENGSGKSTLIEAIAVRAGFSPGGGTKNFASREPRDPDGLWADLIVSRGAFRERSGFFLRAETMFNVATEAEERSYEWESLHGMSHGEAFLWVMNERFYDGGLFILDEPESALSPIRQLSCLARMHDLVATGAQFIMATHSPILMAYPGARIIELDAHGLREVAWHETEHVSVTRAFLANPDAMLRRLWQAAED